MRIHCPGLNIERLLHLSLFRYNAKRASLVQSRIKMLEKLPVLEQVVTENTVTLRFPEVEKLSPPILMLRSILPDIRAGRRGLSAYSTYSFLYKRISPENKIKFSTFFFFY